MIKICVIKYSLFLMSNDRVYDFLPSYYDFNALAMNYFPYYDENQKGYGWKKIQKDYRIVGKIMCWQESFPEIYVDTLLLDKKNNIISRYRSNTSSQIHIEFYYKLGDNYMKYSGINQYGGQLTKIDSINLPDKIENKLIIDDDMSIVMKLIESYECCEDSEDSKDDEEEEKQ